MTETTTVNSTPNIGNEVNTSENVNSTRNITDEVNIKKLSRQMRLILNFMFCRKNRTYQQVDIISVIYGGEFLTLTAIASVSRTMKTLMRARLVESRKAHYSSQFNCMWPDRVRYFLTEKGEEFTQKILTPLAIPVCGIRIVQRLNEA